MARIGISEQQVFEAAEQLLQSGQAVTVSAVREVIGSGSFSTINVMLGKWKETNDHRRPTDAPDMPESVARAMRQLWGAAWKEAQDGIKAEREALEAARRDMERERRDMAAEISRLETENAAQAETMARLTVSLEDKAAALDQAEKAETVLRIENARLDERAKAVESRAEDLKQELAELHRRFLELAETRREGEEKPAGKTSKAKPGKSDPG
ncbi:DNA-binding protein [Methylococcus sp. EFPC2]|uniref:DNA-binding protein n=1 Tax=Methylococcus sp. EFPC2 TaxID=2812648 RepID=UPI0019684206|nr:DNA-binding protein [Methylococcus sp. EFPC2]QSA99327.1 DNA-binding protein [Methylococcus sp. EFPC2]